MKFSIYTVLVAVSTLVTSHSYADDADSKSLWGLGLGIVTGDKGYEGIGTETTPIPVIYHETENFQLLGSSFSYKLSEFGDLTLSLVGLYRLSGYSSSDGDIFDGIKRRSDSFDLGVSAEYEGEFGDVSFEYLADTTNNHDGNEMSLTYAMPYTFNSTLLKPYIKLTRQSDDLVDYYYGVRSNEATSSRAYYRGKATTNIESGVQASYQINRHHNLISYASYTAYGSEIKDSPLMDKSGSFSLIMGYMYVF